MEQDTEIEVGNSPYKIPYPTQVILIIASRLCEQANFYGIRAVLLLYMSNKLGYSEGDAIMLFHGFTMILFFMCILGGILSDTWLGNFRTILILSVIGCVGSIIVSISSFPIFDFSPRIALLVGLFFMSIGSGGIKPSFATFGADQFKVPEQAEQLRSYFSLAHLLVNMTLLIITTITPTLRAHVHCYGRNDCFPLAFGVPAIFGVASIVIFLLGKSSYTHVAVSSENMLILVSKCIMNAISIKICEGRSNQQKRKLLDYSTDKYGEDLVNKTRQLFNIVVLFLPLVIFYAIYEQQSSRWIFQATKMNGDIGIYVIQPDQIQITNGILIIVFIPIFNTVIYPLISKIGIRRPLQKMSIGGFFVCISCLCSALVQFQIESSPGNSVNMMWLMPQYIAITIGEIMLTITSYSFAYEQAPDNMRSVVQALLLLYVGFGNLVVIFTVEFRFFQRQSYEFLLFSAAMFVDMLAFMGLAYKFKCKTPNKVEFYD